MTRPRPVPLPILAAAVLALGLVPAPVAAQDAPRSLSADDYERAERFLPWNVAPLVYGMDVDAAWLDGGRFWYWNRVPDGREVVLVDPARGSRARAFDHERLAAALSDAADRPVDALALPEGLALTAGGDRLTVTVDDRPFACDLASYDCALASPTPEAGRDEVVSPDGSLAAFIRGHDLWVRDLGTGDETRLTTDGVEDFGYATNNAGWTRSDRPVLRWSPDSRKIATFRHDARGVGMMYLVTTNVGHPELDAWRYPLPEDTVIFRISRLVIDLEAGGGNAEIVPFRMPPDPHRSTVCDHVYCGGTFADVEWFDDGSKVAFVSSSRDHKEATLRVADAATGEVRDVLKETVATFYESGFNASNWRVLEDAGELIWYSKRDDWGHLYLHDLETGALKRQVTEGDWNVLEILELDEEERTVTFIGNAREAGDPYFRYLYRVDLDGGEPVLLTPDSADHDVELSPDGRYVLDRYSTPVTPPVTVVRDRDGEVLLTAEEGDISLLEEIGWQPPMPFTVKARDGETDLYGLLFRPTNFDPDRRYPIVNYIYPGPQTGSVGSRSFSPTRRDHQALAELGFVVVALDAMGTLMRSQSFHEAYYGDMGDNGLPDQVTGMEQLAERHPWIDLERAGIWGHSGGGFASTAAMFDYPDFFEVAVSGAGNHDNRNYEDDWGEKWHGLLETTRGGDNYERQANQLRAQHLEGKLLLAHGTLDDNVPPYNTLLVVNALIAANKDFDLIMFPNRGHGFAFEPYMIRKRWDYFVEHLLGAEPPEGYEVRVPGGP